MSSLNATCKSLTAWTTRPDMDQLRYLAAVRKI